MPTVASEARTSAGTSISISLDPPATYDEAGFSALTFTEIGEVTDLGEFGREYNLVTHNPLSTRRTVKRKGSYNDGAVTMQMARVKTDAGQLVLQTGLDTDDSISVEVEYQDGSIDYFSAQVMSYTSNVGSVDQITAASVTLEIDNDIIPVDAPAPPP